MHVPWAKTTTFKTDHASLRNPKFSKFLNLGARLHIRERPRPEPAKRALVCGRSGFLRTTSFSKGDLAAVIQRPGDSVGFTARLAVRSQLTGRLHLRPLVLASKLDGA